MTSQATVFLTADRKKAVPAGDPKAAIKLVHEGQEIAQAEAEKYPGAIELIGGTKKAPKRQGEEEHDHREPEVAHREPRPHKTKGGGVLP